MASINICETHWGTLEEGTDHCNVNGPPCKFVLYMRTDSSKVHPDLDAFDELWNQVVTGRQVNGNAEKRRNGNGRSKVRSSRLR